MRSEQPDATAPGADDGPAGGTRRADNGPAGEARRADDAPAGEAPGGHDAAADGAPAGETHAGGEPAFGPGGYLPPRAAQRARKIVLREQLGLGWVIASVFAGVVLLAAGVWFVTAQLGPPGPPFVAAGEAADLAAGTATQVEAAGADVLLVRAGGRLRAFEAPATAVAYCPESGHLEGADGTVWDLEGHRRSASGRPLTEVAVQVHGDVVYVDPTATVGTSSVRDDGLTPSCPPP